MSEPIAPPAPPPPPPTPASGPNGLLAKPPSRWWQVVRWMPLAGLLVTLVVGIAAVLFLSGFGKVVAWFLTQVAFIAVPVVVAIAAAVRLVVARRRRVRSRLGWPTLICAGATLAASVPWALGFLPIPYPNDRSDATPSVAIRVPVDGPAVVAWGGDSLSLNYHAAFPSQRWAYDLIIEPGFSKSSELSDYGCFGATVFAPIAGEVVWVVDGLIDQKPGQADARNPTGNTVAIEIAATETYLVIAHLQNGSVTVAEGDLVDEGQAIGRCGNSGRSSEPHVHLHHQRQPPDPGALGFAEGLPLSFRDNTGPSFPSGGLAKRDGQVITTGDKIEHIGP